MELHTSVYNILNLEFTMTKLYTLGKVEKVKLSMPLTN
jgi:hypothetical protein